MSSCKVVSQTVTAGFETCRLSLRLGVSTQSAGISHENIGSDKSAYYHVYEYGVTLDFRPIAVPTRSRARRQPYPDTCQEPCYPGHSWRTSSCFIAVRSAAIHVRADACRESRG